jgi:hypothetical protein
LELVDNVPLDNSALEPPSSEVVVEIGRGRR